MQLIEGLDATFPAVIDSTIVSDFRACAQRALLKYFYGIGREKDSIHLHFGAAFARGLEVTRKAFYDEKADVMAALCAGGVAIIKFWGDFPSDPTNGKCLESCLDAHFSYFLEPGHSLETGILKPFFVDGHAAVENTFAWPLDILHPDTGKALVYAGRFDMLGVYNNDLTIVDEKTTTQLGAAWVNSWALRSQITGYFHGSRLYGYDTRMALIRGVGILKRSITFETALQMRSTFQVDRWLEQLHRDIERMINCWKVGYFDFNLDKACSDFGGCPFVDLCNSETPERWLSNYKIKKWEPLRVTGTEKSLSGAASKTNGG